MIYTCKQLVDFANNNPKELALIFHDIMAGFPDTDFNGNESRMSESGYTLPDYLVDWTATINVIEKVGLFWGKIHNNTAVVRMPEFWVDLFGMDFAEFIIESKPNWFPCCALIISAISYKQR